MEIKEALGIIEERISFTTGIIDGLIIDGVIGEAMDTIRDVVAKQTPEKVRPSCFSSTFKKCPRCGEITMDSGKDNGVINAYCQRCGQALDWSENLER